MRKPLNYGVIDWFHQPPNNYDLEAAYAPAQPETMPFSTDSRVPGPLNYGVKDWFCPPSRNGVNLANAFANADWPVYPNTTVTPYPTNMPNLNRYERAVQKAAEINFLNSTPNRVVF